MIKDAEIPDMNKNTYYLLWSDAVWVIWSISLVRLDKYIKQFPHWNQRNLCSSLVFLTLFFFKILPRGHQTTQIQHRYNTDTTTDTTTDTYPNNTRSANWSMICKYMSVYGKMKRRETARSRFANPCFSNVCLLKSPIWFWETSCFLLCWEFGFDPTSAIKPCGSSDLQQPHYRQRP